MFFLWRPRPLVRPDVEVGMRVTDTRLAEEQEALIRRLADTAIRAGETQARFVARFRGALQADARSIFAVAAAACRKEREAA